MALQWRSAKQHAGSLYFNNAIPLLGWKMVMSSTLHLCLPKFSFAYIYKYKEKFLILQAIYLPYFLILVSLIFENIIILVV